MLGLSGSLTVHTHCALSTITPEDQTTAHAYAFIVHTGFTFSGRLTILDFISGPKLVHTCALRLAASPHQASVPGLPTGDHRQLGFMFIGIYMVDSFHRQGPSGLT